MGRRSGYKRSNRQLSGGREQKRASDVGVGGVFILLAFGLLFDATFWFCAIILGFFATLFTVIGLLWIYQRLSGEKAHTLTRCPNAGRLRPEGQRVPHTRRRRDWGAVTADDAFVAHGGQLRFRADPLLPAKQGNGRDQGSAVLRVLSEN